VRHKNTACLILRDNINPEYVQWKINILEKTTSIIFKRNGPSFESNYTYEFAKIKKHIGKRNPIMAIEGAISALTLAVWIMDDAHYDPSHKRYGLSVKRFKNNLEILQGVGKIFSDIGLNFKISSQGYFLFSVESSLKIANMIKAYVPPCMKYKLPTHLQNEEHISIKISEVTKTDYESNHPCSGRWY